MRALLKTSLVEDVLQDLNRLLSDNIFDVADSDVVITSVFEELQLPYNHQIASQYDSNQCFYWSAGTVLGSTMFQQSCILNSHG